MSSTKAVLPFVVGCFIAILLLMVGVENPWALSIGLGVAIALYFRQAIALMWQLFVYWAFETPTGQVVIGVLLFALLIALLIWVYLTGYNPYHFSLN